ncbi:hypothetical protein SAMN05428957_107148 [Oryzisolibacter propanilivorax]|uniref:Uncharacterized protein n=1 Tax=Oryzisolibacter propanilivorax TaxID=1527607 RepID=A0A1G9U309_9BURK|nr:hypothetical protein SAMN05428957_107148 [Oryzisolibacter propanilivorax]
MYAGRHVAPPRQPAPVTAGAGAAAGGMRLRRLNGAPEKKVSPS